MLIPETLLIDYAQRDFDVIEDRVRIEIETAQFQDPDHSSSQQDPWCHVAALVTDQINHPQAVDLDQS